jgi:hypothetical protein
MLYDDHRARERARQDMLLQFRALLWYEDQHKVHTVERGYFITNDASLKLHREIDNRAECVREV